MLYLITPDNYDLHRDNLDAMYRLRHKVFFEKLNWQVKSSNGMEKDEYDENDTYYLVYKDANGTVRGCQRYISMLNPCMFDGPFNFVLSNLQNFKKPEYWEASRLAVDYVYDENYTKADPARVCQAIFAASMQLGLELKIKEFLTLSYPSVARLLSRYFSTSQIAHSVINGEKIVVTSYPPLRQSYNDMVKNLNIFDDKTTLVNVYTDR